jgi:hypothetical protein
MNSTKLVNSIPLSLNEKAILRHLGMARADDSQSRSTLERIRTISPKVLASAEPKGLIGFCDVRTDSNGISILNGISALSESRDACLRIDSQLLGKMCADSICIALVAVTLGNETDALIQQQSLNSGPLEALITDAIASVMAENAISVLSDIARDACPVGAGHPGPRLSPGYGDFSLAWQIQLFDTFLKLQKIGIQVNPETFLLNPRKSVTGLMGFKAVKPL